MPEISKDVVALLQYLLPGFLVAWIYYGVTSHQKPDQFERTIQALIFSVVVNIVVRAERAGLEWIGQFWQLGNWGDSSQLIASLLTAIAIGFAIALLTNKDVFHAGLRNFGFSSRSSHPSEWYGSFAGYPLFIVLHMKDGKRLYGWPEIWPSDPQKGHFFIVLPSWVNEDGTQTELDSAEGILINVEDVQWVEFVKEPENTNDKTCAT